MLGGASRQQDALRSAYVNERRLSEIDHDLDSTGSEDAVERLGEIGRGRDVKLAAHRDHGGRSSSVVVDPIAITGGSSQLNPDLAKRSDDG